MIPLGHMHEVNVMLNRKLQPSSEMDDKGAVVVETISGRPCPAGEVPAEVVALAFRSGRGQI